MTLVIAWLAFAALIAVLCAGCGLLVERIARVRLPGVLVVPIGLAVVILAAQFATALDATAELAVPLALVLAATGWALGDRSRVQALDRWALGAAAVVYLVYGAPVLLSGDPTFAGYIKLDDTSTWFALTDRVMEHGRDLDGLPGSTYEAALKFNLAEGYPVGPFLPFGIGAALTFQDVASVFQPYVSFLAAILALGLYGLVTPVLRSPRLRALAVVIAAQAALLVGYALWGGVKEVLNAALIALVAALTATITRREIGWRTVIPLAVAFAATVSAMSPVGAIGWLGPVLLVAIVLTPAAWRGRDQILGWLRFAAVSLALIVPWLLGAGVVPPTARPLNDKAAQGNLLEPLDPLQIFGLWPVGDFRFEPGAFAVPLLGRLDATAITYILIAIVVAAAVEGVLRSRVRRARPLIAYVIGTLAAAGVITLVGSPWVAGKTLAIASPVALLAALTATGAIIETAREPPARRGAALAAALIAAGVLVSNLLAYREVNLAPRDRHAELERIGEEIAGDGPTLMTEYEPYGVRHFLREAVPEGASELRRHTVPLRNGEVVRKGNFVDLDSFELQGLLFYRTLVLRRTPTGSRPSSAYELVSSGRYFEVWQRPLEIERHVALHLSLGDFLHPTGPAPCPTVRALARAAGRGGSLAFVERQDPIVGSLLDGDYPADWTSATVAPHELVPAGSGTVRVPVHAAAGSYEVWVGGGVKGKLSVSIDGERIGEVASLLSYPGHFMPIGAAMLADGEHEVTLEYDGGGLRPGVKGRQQSLGPVVLATAEKEPKVSTIPARRATELCGRRFDWVEALRPGRRP